MLFEMTGWMTQLHDWARALPRPRAVLIVSAHWESAPLSVSSTQARELVYDFGGFAPLYYSMRYDTPDASALARRVAALVPDTEPLHEHASRGLDHGAWVPLLLMYPAADIPVLQLSIQGHLGPAHHLQLGQALAPLRQEGVLVIGSGSFTHNLRELRRDAGDDDTAPEWVTGFAQWFDAALSEGRRCDLLTYRARAPHAERNHPTEEHLLPLYVALGAAGEGARAERLHASATYGTLRMDAYAFD
jgi:4,5-DOPA dioxygenase extradiol